MRTYGSDHDVLATAHNWLELAYSLALVTVLRTWGSSPRPPGSLLVMRKDGVHAGSVSGGCVEEDLLQRFRNDELGGELPARIDYGVDRQEAMRFGLPCGGRLELLVERLDDRRQVYQLLTAMNRQQLVVRRVSLDSGEATLEPAEAYQEFSYTDEAVCKVFGPRWQILLIGAGYLTRFVAQMAMMLDYRVIVCDPREEYAQGWGVEGTELVDMMPDEAVLEYAGHEHSIVLALTHDPRLDDMTIIDALDSRAFFVGAIGSQRNCDARRERLKQLGLSAQQLQRLHAPVGLDIGSHTPPEIAVSILAQITALRNVARHEANREVTAA